MSAWLTGMTRRGVLKLINAASKWAKVQIDFGDESPEDCEYAEPYGFYSSPLPGAEAIVVQVGADHPVALVVGDRRYRLTTLAAGEVAIADHNGSTVTLKVDGRIVINAATAIELGEGALEALVKGDAFKTLYNAHTHAAGTLANGAGAVTGVTGAPVVAMSATELSGTVTTL